MFICQLLTLLLIVHNVNTSKILGVFHFPSRSHNILGSTLLKALADRGHKVTMLSAFPLEKAYPNYKDLELEGLGNISDDPLARNLYKQNNNFFTFNGIMQMQGLMFRVNEFALNHTVVKQLISSKEKYDVVVQLYFGNDALLGLCHHLEASSVIFSPVGLTEMTTTLTKNPAPISYTPTIILAYANVMNFWERVKNALVTTALELYIVTFSRNEQTYLLKKYFPDSPSIQELRNNVSLVLLNSHFAFEGPRAYLPNMVTIGGFHVKPPNELTDELKDFMDSANNGVILFSLGTNAKSSELSADKIQIILYTFAALAQKILWKFEATEKKFTVPPNVKVLKWLPQQDILVHPNLKAFITHGGLLSTTEALYYGVPMVGIPVYGDQIANINEAVNKGIAVKVDLNTMTQETFSWAIKEVLDNPRYRQAVHTLSKILKDNPISPLDNAIYWIEYVIKHKGAHHLKSVAMNLEWYQVNSLDVFCFMLGTFLLTVLGLCYILSKFVSLLIKLNQTNQSKLKTQ